MSGTHTLTLTYHDDRGDGSISQSTSTLTKTITITKGQVVHLRGYMDGNKWNVVELDGKSAIAVITSDFKDLTNNR